MVVAGKTGVMADTLAQLRRRAILLRGDQMGCETEDETRKIQPNGNSLFTSLQPRWLEQLNICEAGALTKHSLSSGLRPVIVQQPAIIVQPAELVDGEESEVDRFNV